MSRSIRTTSGWALAAWRTASAPSIAVPTTSMPSRRPSISASPSRTTFWSSATSTRTGGVITSPPGRVARARRRQGETDAPSLGRRAGGQPAAGQRGAFGQPGQPVVPGGQVAGRGGNPVPTAVADLDGDLGVGPGQSHGHGGARAGVLGGVGDRLLHGAVDREPDLARQRSRSAGDRVADRRAPTAGVLDQPGQVVGTGQLLAAQRRHRPLGITEAVAGQPLRGGDLLGQPWVAVDAQGQQAGRLQVHGQPGQGVREDVVQLAGQPAALGQHRRLLPRDPGLFLLLQQLLSLGLLVPADRGEGGGEEQERGAGGHAQCRR